MTQHSIVEVLGCSGSIGIPSEGTTSFLVDDDILIDAGTGLCTIPLNRLERIQHVFISHMHLDHFCALPFLIDAVGVGRAEPLKVYGLPQTIRALKDHIFNNLIWPDFSVIPNKESPVLVYEEFTPSSVIELNGRKLTFVHMEHTVPGVAVVVQTQGSGWVFSGDTVDARGLVDLVNQNSEITDLVIETAFPNKEKWLAELSKHLCPSMLAEQLHNLRNDCTIWITHLKPKDSGLILQEITESGLLFKKLETGTRFLLKR